MFAPFASLPFLLLLFERPLARDAPHEGLTFRRSDGLWQVGRLGFYVCAEDLEDELIRAILGERRAVAGLLAQLVRGCLKLGAVP